MKPNYVNLMSPKLLRMLRKLGDDLSIARRKRHLSVEMMCERTGASKQTYRRMEQGDPSVSLGVLAMTLFALGEENRLQTLIDVSGDDVGLINDVTSLPKRIRGPK